MCIHCLIKTLVEILWYCMILLFMLCIILSPSDISERVITYPLQGGFSDGESARTSSEVDEDMERRMEDDTSRMSGMIAGGYSIQCQEDILEEDIPGMSVKTAGGSPIQCQENVLEDDTSRMSGMIAGGYSIKCQEDILESSENLASSRQASSDPIVSGGITPCNGSRRLIECHLIDEYIDLHPEIPIRSIQADQDRQIGAHQQADRPFQACLGTESAHTPMHSHSPFDGGTDISEHVQDGYQDDSGGAPNTEEFARSIRRGTLCIVCKKNTVEVKFETCGHAVCCFECAFDMQHCNVCQTMILFKTSSFIYR